MKTDRKGVYLWLKALESVEAAQAACDAARRCDSGPAAGELVKALDAAADVAFKAVHEAMDRAEQGGVAGGSQK